MCLFWDFPKENDLRDGIERGNWCICVVWMVMAGECQLEIRLPRNWSILNLVDFGSGQL